MPDIILYHGTASCFNKVDLRYCKDRKDFGKGFYTTTDINQAQQWAFQMQKEQFKDGNYSAKALIYSFKFDKDILNTLKTHKFQNANISWLDYIVGNRFNGKGKTKDYDLVIGPVADAAIKRVLKTTVIENINKSSSDEKLELIKKLEAYRLIDQYCFKTEKAIRILNDASVRISAADRRY